MDDKEDNSTEPKLGKFPTEVFGYPFTDTSEETQKRRKQQYCPFRNAECNKPRKSSPNIKVGTCSVGYKGESLDEFRPVIICPHRFPEKEVMDSILRQLFPNRAPDESVEIASEVSIGHAGSVDYVLALKKGLVISDFLCVEIQAAGTTGTPYDAVTELVENGKYKRQSYDFGINWANEFLKTMMQQVFKKSVVVSGWGKQIVFVIQDVALKYLESKSSSEVIHGYSTEDPAAFVIFELRWNPSDKKWELAYKEIKSVSLSGVISLLNATAGNDELSEDEFKKNLERKLRSY